MLPKWYATQLFVLLNVKPNEANLLASNETNPDLKENYEIVAQSCRNIITEAPSSFIDAVQWINFFQVFERIIGHGNGYGRLDQLLLSFYKKDIEKGIITHETVDQLFDRIYKDEKFIKGSKGGITFTGGEPALQYSFIAELAQKLKADSFHLALDTCGAASAIAYETLVPLMDLILYDLKEMNDKKHRQFTGLSNKLIHKNLLLMLNLIDQHQLKTELWIPTPLIPGMTDTPENIRAIDEFLSQNNLAQKWELCTFNNLCIAKYRKLGQNWSLEKSELLSNEQTAILLGQAKRSAPDILSISLSGLTKTNKTN